MPIQASVGPAATRTTRPPAGPVPEPPVLILVPPPPLHATEPPVLILAPSARPVPEPPVLIPVPPHDFALAKPARCTVPPPSRAPPRAGNAACVAPAVAAAAAAAAAGPAVYNPHVDRCPRRARRAAIHSRCRARRTVPTLSAPGAPARELCPPTPLRAHTHTNLRRSARVDSGRRL